MSELIPVYVIRRPYLISNVLHKALREKGFPPRNFVSLLSDQGMDVSIGANWFSMEYNHDYLFCNAENAVDAYQTFTAWIERSNLCPW